MDNRRPPDPPILLKKRNELRENRTPLANLAAQLLVGQLTETINVRDENMEEREKYLQLVRDGNPFPAIGYFWPEILITNPSEAKYFQGEIGDKSNPCLRLDDWQRDWIIKPFFDPSIFDIGIKGCTKAGKGASIAICVNLWFDAFESKVILTSGNWDHAHKVMFGEISAWRARMHNPMPANILGASFHRSERNYITISNPKTGEGFSGQHGDYTLFVMDEATSIPDHRYDDACKQAKKIAAAANPRTLFGWFRNLYKRCKDANVSQYVDGDFGRRACVTVGGLDCLNVRERRLEKPFGPIGGLEINGTRYGHNDPIAPEDYEHVKPLIPRQVDYARSQAIRQHPDPNHIAIFADGKFPEEDPEKQVILGSWLGFHEEAWKEWGDNRYRESNVFALDVARSLHGDMSCFAGGCEKGVADLHKFQYADVNKVAQRCIRLARHFYKVDLRRGQNPVVVDVDGLGGGAADVLKSFGVWVIEFRGNTRSDVDPNKYANARTEAYGTLGRRLSPSDRWGGIAFALPPREELRQELTAPEKVYATDAIRWGIQPKRKYAGMRDDIITIMEKIGRSPDEGDTVAMLFRGIRDYNDLNELFRAYSEPLVIYPDPERDSESDTKMTRGKGDEEKDDEMNEDLFGDLPEDGEDADLFAQTPAISDSDEVRNGQDSDDLLNWLIDEYGDETSQRNEAVRSDWDIL